ncbi:MAG TPA: CocE/NonD family hydrolase [Drouetiella sp.]
MPAESLNYRLFLPAKQDQSKGVPSVYAPKPTNKGYTQTSRYVQLKDGTKLAVEIYLPDTAKPGDKIPTIMELTRYWRVIEPKFPYNKLYSKPLSPYRYEFITHGYAWVVVDSRGAGSSFGDRPWELTPLDRADAAEMIDWVVKQTWCNGKIGLIGHSFSGNLAELALINENPAVKACAVLSSPFDIYTDVMRPGGIPNQPFIQDWGNLSKNFDNDELPNRLKKYQMFVHTSKPVDADKNRALIRAALEQHKNNNDVGAVDKVNFRDDSLLSDKDKLKRTATFDKCIEMVKAEYGSLDKAVARGLDIASPSGYYKEVDKSQVPLYMGAGWEEGTNADGAIKRFLNYTAPGTKLILGPWEHNYMNISPYTHGGPSKFRIDAEMMKFFDLYLKGIKEPIDRDKPVNYYTMGEEKWHGSNTWPPKTEEKDLYLGSGNELVFNRPATAGRDLYKVDVTAGTGRRTRWDCLLGQIIWTPHPNRKQDDKKLIVYETGILEKDIKVTGHPSVKLFVKPNAPDAAVFVYLEDVAPNGVVRYLTEGELLCGMRINPDRAPLYKTVNPMPSFLKADYKPLDQTSSNEVNISMQPISTLFKKGHRIRLAIGGLDSDHFKAPKFTKLASQMEICTGSECPSMLSLPVDLNPN